MKIIFNLLLIFGLIYYGFKFFGHFIQKILINKAFQNFEKQSTKQEPEGKTTIIKTEADEKKKINTNKVGDYIEFEDIETKDKK